MASGDVDMLLMDNCRESRSKVKYLLFGGDTTICLATVDEISLFFNAGQNLKHFIMKNDYTTETGGDLSGVGIKEDCIFFCIGINTFIKLTRTEKSDIYFQAMICMRHEKRVASISKKVYMSIREEKNMIGDVNRYISRTRKFNGRNLYFGPRNEINTGSSNKIYRLITSLVDQPYGKYISLPRTKRKALVPQAVFHRTENFVAPHTGQIFQFSQVSTNYNEVSTNCNEYLPNRNLESRTISHTPNTPKYPEYADRFAREETFKNWMYERVQDPRRLSSLGFFSTKMMDLVRCFSSGLGLKDFTNTDDPLTEHIRYSENCDFLVIEIGRVRINSIKDSLVHTDPEFCRRQQLLDLQNKPRRTIPETSSAQYRHPKLISFEARLGTFSNWPKNHTQTPEQLARAGLFYTGNGDIVRCFACDGGLQRWDPTDDPMIEHCRWFPACPFLLSEKGEEYVRLVQHAVEAGDETQLQAARDPLTQDTGDLETRMEGLAIGGGRNKETQTLVDKLKEMGFEHEHILMALSRTKKDGKIVADIDDVIEEIYKIQKPSLEFLQEENKKLKDKLVCEKCKKANREALFLPCKHLRMCMTCSENFSRCPVKNCDANILHRIKTYIS